MICLHLHMSTSKTCRLKILYLVKSTAELWIEKRNWTLRVGNTLQGNARVWWCHCPIRHNMQLGLRSTHIYSFKAQASIVGLRDRIPTSK